MVFGSFRFRGRLGLPHGTKVDKGSPVRSSGTAGLSFWVYGIGYGIAGCDPARHWPIVLVGLLGKVFGPIGFIWQAVILGNLPLSFGWFLIGNDLIGWVLFFLILLYAKRQAALADR